MDEKRKDVYVAGAVCVVIFFIFLGFIVISASSMSGQTLWILRVFTAFLGVLGFGSLLKPDSFIGAIASELLKRMAKNAGERSDSHDKQVQKKSSGIQIMTHDQSKVIIVPSGKKEQTESLTEEKEEQKETLRKETIEVSSSDSYFYEFEFTKGDHLKGEISSTSRIDLYFMDEFNFDKWNRGRKYFEPEDSNEAVLEANIDYLVPTKGTWYMIIENNGRKSAPVKVRLC